MALSWCHCIGILSRLDHLCQRIFILRNSSQNSFKCLSKDKTHPTCQISFANIECPEKKTFQCPIKKSPKTVCYVLLYPNMRFFFGKVERFYGADKSFFFITQYTQLPICRTRTLEGTLSRFNGNGPK